MSSLSIRLPDSLHQQVRALSKQDNVSINQFIVSAITEKMAAFLTRDYLEARAKQASEARFLAALAKVPDVEPEAADRLPKGN